MVDSDQTDTKWGVVRVYTITPDKTKRDYFFLFLHECICCGYSLEAPR